MDLIALNKDSTEEHDDSKGDHLIDIMLEEEEEELFEINLDVVNKIPPPQYNYWKTSNKEALLANCLLPISHLSGAVPIQYSPYASKTTSGLLFLDLSSKNVNL